MGADKLAFGQGERDGFEFGIKLAARHACRAGRRSSPWGIRNASAPARRSARAILVSRRLWIASMLARAAGPLIAGKLFR
jgi:hypothetical protein